MDEKSLGNLVDELANYAIDILRRVNERQPEEIQIKGERKEKQPLSEQELLIVTAAERVTEKLIDLEIQRLALGIKR